MKPHVSSKAIFTAQGGAVAKPLPPPLRRWLKNP